MSIEKPKAMSIGTHTFIWRKFAEIIVLLILKTFGNPEIQKSRNPEIQNSP
jgi:hypothetical protein